MTDDLTHSAKERLQGYFDRFHRVARDPRIRHVLIQAVKSGKVTRQ